MRSARTASARLDTLEDGGVEGAAFVDVFAFEVGADDFAFACGRRACEGCAKEARAGGSVGAGAVGADGPAVEVGFHPSPVVGVVGDDAEFAAGLEDAPGVAHEVVLNHAAFVVSLLGPGVGEVKMDDAGDGGGRAEAEEVGGVGVEHADVGEVVAADAVCGVAEELAGVFDAEEVGVGLEDGLLGEEGAFAGADLEFERSVGVVEPGAEVDPGGLGVVDEVVGKRGEVFVEDAEAGDVELFAA